MEEKGVKSTCRLCLNCYLTLAFLSVEHSLWTQLFAKEVRNFFFFLFWMVMCSVKIRKYKTKNRFMWVFFSSFRLCILNSHQKVLKNDKDSERWIDPNN